MPLQDIQNREDLTTMMAEFYRRAPLDPVLAPKFEGLDLEAHLPVIVNFWEGMLFGKAAYKGNPFEKHIRLEPRPEHFDRWIHHFREVAGELFAGPKTDEMVSRAEAIARVWAIKFGGPIGRSHFP